MSHTPIPQGHLQHPQRKPTPNQSRQNNGNNAVGVDQTTDLTARMSQMSTGNPNPNPPPHTPITGPGNDQNIYNTGSILRPLLPPQPHHSTPASHSFGTPMTHLATPQGGYGYQDFGIPYWAATGGAGAHSNAGSAPPSAGAHMELFGLPFTPTDASPATATFPYGSTLDGNMLGGGNGVGQNGVSGYEQYLPLGGQHHLQTAADIYATGQDTRHGGGFGLTAPPPPRGRGGYNRGHQNQQQSQNQHQHQHQNQNQNQQHHQQQQQNQNQNHQTGWSPHDGLDGGMANLGTGRLSDPATKSYYGLGGHGYGVNQGMYGIQNQNDRRKPNRASGQQGARNGGRGYVYQPNDYLGNIPHLNNGPLSPLMSPVSIASQITGYQPQHTLPIHYGLHLSYVPTTWQQQNPYSRREHVPRSPLLDEFRMNKSRRWALQDIAGSMVEFCGDQHGSRFIQQHLEHGTDEDRTAVLAEIEPNVFALMMDVFGNYVIQKLFEICDQNQKAHLASIMEGNVYKLSLEMYGCRVVQKAFEHVLRDQRDRLVEELRGKVIDCVKDSNGNHVIQRLLTLDSCPDFIHQSFVGHINELASHTYGCRVLQKTFESLDCDKTRPLLEEIHTDIVRFTHDQYGNYVIQSVITSTTEQDRSRIIKAFSGNLQTMARHKYASNVIEQALKLADAQERRDMVEELIGEQPDGTNQIQKLLKDAYGNFPVQTALTLAEEDQRETLLEGIIGCLPQLKHTPVGKRLEMRLVEYDRHPQDTMSNYATPPLNSLSASTSASEPLSGPETIMSEDTGLTSPDRGHANGKLFSPSGGTGTKSAVMGPGAGGGGGKAGVKPTYSAPHVGGRDDKSLEDLLH